MTYSNYVTVHALDAGYLTLPEAFFVTPLDDKTARKTVPSLSFLIQHTDTNTAKTTRIVFDLGIRRHLEHYAEPLYKHAMTRRPLSGDPDTTASLAAGGLSVDDIDIVMFSHLHWDHVGMPSDYPNVSYVIGPGARKLLNGSRKVQTGGHNYFEEGLLDPERTIELPSPCGAEEFSVLDNGPTSSRTKEHQKLFQKPWTAKAVLPQTIDIFDDCSVYVVSAPGHLDGHINLLCRQASGEYVYLAGDSCHDERLLSGEKDIATWADPSYSNVTCCIHRDKAAAEETLGRIRSLLNNQTELGNVEIVFAHNRVWAEKAKRNGRFFPGAL
jgi:glyoxylase-like metal-dependent hydrolase (beta-lactamase superfamily II)